MFFTPCISCSSALFVECPLVVLGHGEGSRWALLGHAACRGRREPDQKKSGEEKQ